MNRSAFAMLSFGTTICLFTGYCAETLQCIGPSMLPTLYPHDVVLLDKLSHRLPDFFGVCRSFKIGDVICATAPHDPNMLISKRIMGLPRDLICKDPLLSDREYVRVPEGHVWLQGDNVCDSTDSRTYGPVPISLLKGRILCTLWPSVRTVRNGIEATREMIEQLTQVK